MQNKRKEIRQKNVPSTTNAFTQNIQTEEEYFMLCENKEINPTMLAIFSKTLVTPQIVYLIDLPDQNYKNSFTIEFSLFGFKIINESTHTVDAYNVFTKNLALDCAHIDVEFLRGLACIAFSHLESRIGKHIFIYEIIMSPRFNEYLRSCLMYIIQWRIDNGFQPQ